MNAKQVLYNKILEGMRKLDHIRIIGHNKNSAHIAFKNKLSKSTEGVYVVYVHSTDFITIDYDSPSVGMTVASFKGEEATAGNVVRYVKVIF